jgi:ABC-type Fe3+ transport system substrate-binding protein
MKYYLARFLGYMIVVATDRHVNATKRLVEYVRVTKGNVGYSEEQIIAEAKINSIDMVDDVGYLSGLQRVAQNLTKIKKETDERIQKELQEVERLKKKLRDLMQSLGDEDEDYYDD